jgi:hypothetical protein
VKSFIALRTFTLFFNRKTQNTLIKLVSQCRNSTVNNIRIFWIINDILQMHFGFALFYFFIFLFSPLHRMRLFVIFNIIYRMPLVGWWLHNGVRGSEESARQCSEEEAGSGRVVHSQVTVPGFGKNTTDICIWRMSNNHNVTV